MAGVDRLNQEQDLVEEEVQDEQESDKHRANHHGTCPNTQWASGSEGKGQQVESEGGNNGA